MPTFAELCRMSDELLGRDTGEGRVMLGNALRIAKRLLERRGCLACCGWIKLGAPGRQQIGAGGVESRLESLPEIWFRIRVLFCLLVL